MFERFTDRARRVVVLAQEEASLLNHSYIGTEHILLGLIDAASEPLAARHAAEVAELDERIKAYGERGSGKKQLDERHKRELRRYRTDELRSGLAAMAATYRDTAVNAPTADVDACADAVRRIHRAMEMLDRNPNEKLLVESLLWSLPDAQGT